MSNSADNEATQETPDGSQSKQDIIESLEEVYKGKLINYSDLYHHPKYSKYQLFAKMLMDISPYQNPGRVLLIFDLDNTAIKVIFFTEEKRYSIRVTEKYMGCVMQQRKSRPGEIQFRGTDLPDGDYSQDTWDRIKNRIIQTEIKALQVFD